jgi:CBS domain containing-hemolysin-like protein
VKPTLKAQVLTTFLNFKEKNMFISAALAGITVVVSLLITMVFSQLLFKFTMPENNSQLVNYLCLAFALGYFIDIFIDKMKLFGSTLELFYKTVGSGFWGALAFIFCIIISYFLLFFYKNGWKIGRTNK